VSLAAVVAAWLACPAAGAQELGSLVSPGPLHRSHAKLEGLKNCEKCHEPGRRVTAARCLACHGPIAERIAAKKGVHRDVTDDCVSCHVEHAGDDAELRPIDTDGFDHAAETGFPLDGRHAAIARDCARCHKTRSFLTNRPECGSCHQDPHKGSLGGACATCHSTSVPFKEAAGSFDHSRAAFHLTGAHVRVACEKCHVQGKFRGVAFGTCASCHTSPHTQAFQSPCASCHATDSWRTTKVAHDRTRFPLKGKHAAVACASCHVQPATRVRPAFAACASCHEDPHRGKFKDDCASCHTEAGFRGGSFDHATRTTFALTGRHAAIPCASCHETASTAGPRASPTVEFRRLEKTCTSCHADVHAGSLGGECSSCHGTEAFRVASFQHPRNREFFAGRHAAVPCAKCHVDGAVPAVQSARPSAVSTRQYRGMATECVTCHSDVHLGQLGAKCASCHTVDGAGFKATNFLHESTSFPLTGAHERAACARCHVSETGVFPAGSGTAVRFAATDRECDACHKDVHAGSLGPQCQSCHGTSTFRVASYTHRSRPELFVGTHATLACASCHKPGEGEPASSAGLGLRFAVNAGACAPCHQDPHRGTLGARCESCHAPDRDFHDASRAFHKATTFPLEGQHLKVPCASCHLEGVLEGTPTRCYDCHWVRRQDDRYATRLGVECESCHRPSGWRPATWDHGGVTGFVLNASHRTLACESCHSGGQFQGGLSPDCYSCHRGDFERAANPPHVASGFPTTCTICHHGVESTWQGAQFDHASTFALVGVHSTQRCESCHSNGVYRGTSRECVGCHLADYQQTKDPNHATAGFPTACETCHRATDTSWDRGLFDHAAVFQLVGVHSARTCESCHVNGVYRGTPRECVGCHLADYQQTKDPNHATAGFPTACETCHRATDTSWDRGRFDHQTTFPLLGVHAAQECQSCHVNGVYRGTPRECVGCHLTDYQQANEPNHVTAGFPTTCETCHRATDTSWDQGRFDHQATFPLLGVHATQQCQSCHVNGVYQGTPRECSGCHMQVYQQADNPNHVAAGFLTACETCHRATDAGWQQGTYAHTTWALVGAHTSPDCATCHVNNVYAGLPSECVSCHLQDYQQAQNPNHAAAGFPTTCETCHRVSDTSWDQGTFDHTSYFPLIGVHATQPCQACHVNNVFPGTPRECSGCHLDDYQQTQDPNHAAAGFATACEACHLASDANWDQGRYGHTVWPLVGAHSRPTTCVTCHVNNVYSGLPSECVSCHLQDYQEAQDPNHVAAGFPTTCETCHRVSDTSWDQGTFDHAWFPITSGKHAGFRCSECHPNPSNFAIFQCTTACHPRAKMDDKHKEIAGYAYESSACYGCHPDGRKP
jgi:hypothetical protein